VKVADPQVMHWRRVLWWVLLRVAVLLLLIAAAAISLLAGCTGQEEPPRPKVMAVANSSEPKWIYQNTPHADVALVFVHGIFGDAQGTWKNPNGKSFFDLVRDNTEVGKRVDIFAFGFTSYMFASGSLDIQEAANKLHDRLVFHRVTDYPRIVFVAHSMGGLVVLRELLTHKEILDSVPVMIFYATPQEGAQIAAIARNVANNVALEQMLPGDTDGYLRSMDSAWKAIPVSQRPQIRCAYEKKPTYGVVIVGWASATRFCDGTPSAISENHLDIVKPDREAHDSVIVLINALNEFVPADNVIAQLETPDFIQSGDDLVFTLASPFGKQSARLVNAGKKKLRYTIARLSDPLLYVWPADTPRFLAGGAIDHLQFGLGFGASASEYRFALLTDGAPDRNVVVKVADPAALRAQQVKLAEAASANISAMLAASTVGPASGGPASTTEPRSPTREDIVETVREAVQKTTPDLPEVGQWALTAEVMNAVHWPDLAVLALKNAERVSPNSVRAPAIQRLAALSSEQSGTNDALTWSKASQATVAKDAHASAKKPNLFLSPSSTKSSLELATQLKNFPALKPYGLSLEGDVKLYQGNKDGAFRAYSAAAKIKPSPSIERRLPLTKNDTGVLKFVPQKEREMAINSDLNKNQTGNTKSSAATSSGQ
jgi:pimeloyl-ACP methyl ester carboxylesterase